VKDEQMEDLKDVLVACFTSICLGWHEENHKSNLTGELINWPS